MAWCTTPVMNNANVGHFNKPHKCTIMARRPGRPAHHQRSMLRGKCIHCRLQLVCQVPLQVLGQGHSLARQWQAPCRHTTAAHTHVTSCMFKLARRKPTDRYIQLCGLGQPVSILARCRDLALTTLRIRPTSKCARAVPASRPT